MPHPMNAALWQIQGERVRLSFWLHANVLRICRRARRGSDSSGLMYLSGKAIHTFWAPIRRTGPTFRRSSTRPLRWPNHLRTKNLLNTSAIDPPYLTLYANSVHYMCIRCGVQGAEWNSWKPQLYPLRF